MLLAMRVLFHPRSRPSRGFLAVTLLAWAMLAFGAFARPIAMAGPSRATPSPKPMAMSSAMSAHCDDMSQHTNPSAPAQPMNGHGCCHGGGCYCSSSCSPIAGTPLSLVTWQPVHGPAIRPIHSEPGLTQAAPPLRPPIA